MTSPLPASLQTNRLLFRQPVAADARALYDSYTQDLDVARFMVWRPHTSLAETEAFIERCLEGWDSGLRRPYVMALSGTPARPIGMLEARWLGHIVDIGYVLARQHWGDGLMPEAAASVAEAVLSDPRVFRVQATCDVENAASAKALEKAGFFREGRLDRFMVHPNVSADPRPCFMYARCR
ncbi:GNAT family N-acetyltransferase [Rhizobacter sp. LjRoot28]|jgi:RimJ/RimL family protein N-acetyltransferase|uniref:GNAT family N-acetyltransferase n=1 Tax=Rhizobacter sp. LjRoot28 TaxID=3342309 RepID=UPI003ECF489B